MLAKLQKWLVGFVIKHYSESEQISVESQAAALRRYVDLVDIPLLTSKLGGLSSTTSLMSQFDNVHKLYVRTVDIRQALDNKMSLSGIYSSAGKLKRFTKDFLTIANGVYVKPDSYLPHLLTEISTVLTHAEKLRSSPDEVIHPQNEYILQFFISDMLEVIKHLIEVSRT